MILRKLTLPIVVLFAGAALVLFPAGGAAAEGVAAQQLSNCTTTTAHTISNDPLHFVIVPAASGGGKSCLIGDPYIGCGGPNCSAIKRLQRSLNHCYGKNLQVDGYWGPLTKAALRDVQNREGVDDDGVYGPETRNAMNHRSDGDQTPGLHCHPY